jgi:hypothetical protein
VNRGKLAAKSELQPLRPRPADWLQQSGGRERDPVVNSAVRIDI